MEPIAGTGGGATPEMAKLLDLLLEGPPAAGALSAFRPSLRRLRSLLALALRRRPDGRLGFQLWDPSQVTALMSAAKLLVSASYSADLDDPTVAAIAAESVELCTSYLEVSDFDSEELHVEIDIAQLLEAALVGGGDCGSGTALNISGLAISEDLPAIQDDFLEVSDQLECNFHDDGNCWKERHQVDRAFVASASGLLRQDATVQSESSFSPVGRSTISFVRHWAVVHIKCVHRILTAFKDLLYLSTCSIEQTSSANFQLRVFAAISILNILGKLMHDAPYAAFNSELLNAVVCCAKSLCVLLGSEFEFGYCDTLMGDGDNESQVLILLENFIKLVHIIFGDGCIFQNIRTCIAASIMDALDANLWNYNGVTTSPNPPIVYFPKIILFFLRHVRDIKNLGPHAYGLWEKFNIYPSGSFDPETNTYSYDIGIRRVTLLKKYSQEEQLNIIFHQSKQWTKSLIHAGYFLHSEGIKSRLKMDRLCSMQSKKSVTHESDNPCNHEDDALFGDLFSEATRPLGSSDSRHEQSSSCTNISASDYLLHVSTEVLTFLKTCIFSPEWNVSIYNDACKKMDDAQISFLLYILSCQVCLRDDRTCETSECPSAERNINAICFDLFQNLFTNRALSPELEEHLVRQILKVENAKYAYNDYTLALLAHVFISSIDVTNSQLITNAYKGFIGFILEKTKNISSSFLESEDSTEFLPSIFHLELLLMGFHLSTDAERASLATILFNSIKTLDPPSFGCSAAQLSLWGLLVSRLLLVLHHMLLFPTSCPSWLLRNLKFRLGEVSQRPHSNANTDGSPLSWTATSVKGVMDNYIKDATVVNNLLPHLADFGLLGSDVRDTFTFVNLKLNATELCSSLFWILSFWEGRKAEAVEDLIVERYIFMLCWNTAFAVTSYDSNLTSEWKDLDLSTESFFYFGTLLLKDTVVDQKDGDFSLIFSNLLSHLQSSQKIYSRIGHGWDFLRGGSWLSLVLSLIYFGIWRSEIDCLRPPWNECVRGESTFAAVAENIMDTMFKEHHVGELICILSSFLKMYLDILQEAFVNVFDHKKCFQHGFSPMILLKHECYEGHKRDELLENCGSDSTQLDFVFSLLSKLDGITRENSAGCKEFLLLRRFMLHGVPCYTDVHSAAFVSSILIIRDIIYTLDGLLKVRDKWVDGSIEVGGLYNLLNSIVTIKSDKIFHSIHATCGTIYAELVSVSKGLDFSCLFQLKDIQRFLISMDDQDISDSCIRETLVTTAIELLERLKQESSKTETFELYLNPDRLPLEVKDIVGSSHSDLLVLLSALDKDCSEAIIVKVINFFVDILGGALPCLGLKEKVLHKFIEMDLPCLSQWVGSRLLGNASVSSEGGVITEGSLAVREATMNFLTCLINQTDEVLPRKFHCRLVEAMLISLDNVFISYDIYTSKSFFKFLLQFLNGMPFIKKLLERIAPLMQKLGKDEGSLQVLKYLVGFLRVVLGDCGAHTNVVDTLPKKLPPNANFGAGLLMTGQVGVSKKIDNTVLPDTQGTPVHIDCEVISADEDEDDGTSDGDIASIEKDEDDDSNSEKTLASKVCTFTSSGSNFMEQHWYFCYTCDLTVSKGCCSVCAKVCHRGHRVVYSRSSRFFCDCGAGGVRGNSCQCLKPRKVAANNGAPVRNSHNLQSFLPLSEVGDQPADSESDLDEDLCTDIDNLKLSIPREVQEGLASLFVDLGLEDRILELCDRLLPSVTSRRDWNVSKEKKITLGLDETLSYNTEIFQLKKSYKGGSFDLKIRADYSNSRELKSHLSSGSLAKSLLTVSARGRLAVGEGDKVSIFDVGQLIGQQSSASAATDKPKPLSKNTVRFEIVHLMFNPVMENYLLVAGYDECQVLTINPRGEVTDRLAVELAVQGSYIRRVCWVPGSQVLLLVVTNMFVKIYDLSQDNISPIHYFTLEADSIMDGVLVAAPFGKFVLLVLSELGSLFRLGLSMECNVGAKPLKDVLEVPRSEANSRGFSLHYSPSHRFLFLSYENGTTLIGRLNADASSINEVTALHEDEHEGKIRSASLHHWKDLHVDSGVFVCFSSLKQNAALSISLRSCEVHAQNMRHPGGSSFSVVGIAAYKPLSKDRSHCLVLHDDGSLQIYLHAVDGGDTNPNSMFDQARKIGAGILSNKAYASANPEFPLDFFEKAMCITADVKLSSEAIRNSDTEGAKQRLASEDGFLESPIPAGFKISVSNTNPEIVMVGFRVHVGNTSHIHIPSDIAIFHRKIKLDEGMRSWYDVPFTVAESLLADEEFVISVGPTFDSSSLPRIDSLEVYGRSKDDFGWKEKMDAILAMEAEMLGSTCVSSGSGKKSLVIKSSSVHEQVLADALKLLSKLYSLRKCHVCTEAADADMVLEELKCKKILEMIFESDREPLLHSAACHVLQAIFPKREIYYHVKDTMCLLGVIKSSHELASWMGFGGAATKWAIKEFTAKMRTVSKITLLRRSTMVAFLETHGSEVVDELMQVIWGIFDLDQPDTQTINSVIIPSVELIYGYAECLAFNGTDISGCSIAPAVKLLMKLIFAPYEPVQTSSSLAISSRLLQVPFPKQTMLATDDSIENPPVTHSRINATNSISGSIQPFLEEDSGTSSVQYCCDGCSTVPILRRRWHCDVCPDFDLCEACYEVMDAERLPPPHSKDHPMSAIPIEVDSLGGDGNGIQFSMDDLGDSSLTQVPVNDGMQISPLTHAVEFNETGEFPPNSTDQRVVSISASKRAVNSLLILQLIEELKGWMVTTSGVRAIPVMQLFYRLSSAVGGPFTDCSKPENLDLGKFVKWLLDEINLEKPFVAKVRSSFGEVTILVFMFFTLMLRNWHQPGGDSSHTKAQCVADVQDKNSPSILSSHSASCSKIDQEKNEFTSQLYRACSYLRQQKFINYLMDILHQLVPLFKSSTGTTEGIPSLPSNSGCGSLLTVRKELPAGNFAPFFSDSYAKAHRLDLFMDYHKLLLENTFRLVYSLVRPEKQDRSADKDKIYRTTSKDLKLDGTQDDLCNYISNPNTSFVRRYARRLFLHLCGSKTHYYNVRDSWQFSHEVKRLYKLVSKSGGLKNAFPYERSVKLVKCLSTMAEVAIVRPRNWQKYCSKHGDILSFLIEGVFFFSEESVIQALKLLNLALYFGKDMLSSLKPEGGDTGSNLGKSGAHASDSKKKRKAEDGSETTMEKLCLDMEHAVGILFQKEVNLLRQFVDMFLLDWNSSSVRGEAKCVLYGAWHHGKHEFKETLLTVLLQKIKCLPMFGQNIVECCELLTMLLGKVPDSAKQLETEVVAKCLTADVIRCIFETLHSQNELLANHPNSRIYNTLSALVEFDGYYLESEPCVACSCPEVPYGRMKLETLKFETKYTDNRIIVKCTGSYTIQSLTMNVHDARKSKSVKVLNLYYNNRPVSDLSELKNNWTLWKRAKSCHLAFSQTELKIEFPIPITACNFMIELDSFYENLQASSLEALQCPRCSRPVTDKHGIYSNCHENAYQCRQCRNINYENLDSFLCNECGYSKYGRFEFNFMARPSFMFDSMENDEDMKRGLAAIDSESENAHRRYQQLIGFKKPLLKLVSSIGEHEMDSQQKDTVQQLMVSLPGPSCKINRKVALLGMLYGEKCKSAFDSVSKSVQTLQGLRRVLMSYLQKKSSGEASALMRFTVPRSPNNCYGCATTFVTHCMDLLHVLCKLPNCRKQLVAAGILSELFENNIHQGPKTARTQARAVLCAFTEGDSNALAELNSLIQKKVMYCIEHHRSMDVAQATREELLLLSETCAMVDDLWESRLRIAFQLLFASIRRGSKHPVISEHIILPCLRIVSQACTPPKSEASEQMTGLSGPGLTRNDDATNMASVVSGNKSTSDSSDKHWDACRRGQDIPLVNYSEWERGASYLDFVRRQYKISQAVKASSQRSRQGSHRADYLVLKYGLRWKHLCCKRTSRSDFSSFGLGCWVSELILSSCSQSIRAEVCSLICLLCPQNSLRRFQLLNLLMTLLPATLSVGESSAEYFELFFKVIDSETSRLFLTAKGCLASICRLISQEVENIESQERSLNIDISQGFIIHKLVELLGKFLELPNIRFRFMRDELLSRILESLIVIRGLVVQKTKLISDCNKLLKDLLDSLLLESNENKRQFIRACISGLQVHGKDRKGRTCLFILEQLCNIICPSKPEPVYHLILSKAHTQEEFIRGSMTKNPYSSSEIGPLMRDVKNKICHQLDLLGLLEDDYGMELLVAGNIISLDLSISQVYEQVWKKSQSHAQTALTNTVLLASGGVPSARDCPPMTVTYRLQGLDGEATEPMIKELEEEREESLDPEIEFAIAGAVRDFGGLEIILDIIQNMRDDDLKHNQEELGSVLNLLMYCCKIRENRRVLLKLGALGLLLETARRAFLVDAMEPAEGILLIVESLTIEANESDVDTTQCVTVSSGETGTGDQAEKIVLMFLERLSHSGLKKSNKQQRNNEMVARILPYLTYGEPAAMYALVDHFNPYLQDWNAFDFMLKQYEDNPKNENFCLQASQQRSEVENFVRVSESLRTSSCGERLKDIILEKGITAAAVNHLRKCFAVTGQAGFKTTPEWQIGLKLPSVPLILSMLRGLSKGHLATQKGIDEGGILPLLHALEGVPGENEIGARAENLLDTLADKEKNGDGFLGKKVHELRHATRNEMRQRALRKREELLQGLGMRQELSSDGGERIVVALPLIDGLEDVEEEEDGLACMVCREGYTLRPNDMLGVYSFSKRVNLGPSSSGSSRGECVYTTVSHFNIIHFQCHQEAKRADAALKNPKKEWEGATLRNNETLCNAIFPLKGPSVPLSQYVRYVDQYWDNLSALGRADGNRLRLLTYDIVLMLARFATGASFSTDSKGGGRESNSRFLPFMIHMACHLLDQGTPGQQCRAMAKSISTYLSSAYIVDSPTRTSSISGGRPNSEPAEETVQFMMVNSLLTESYEEWSQHLLTFLKRGIYHAYMQHTHGRSTLRLSSDLSSSADMSDAHGGNSSDNTDLFPIIHPMLVYTGLIEQLQRFLKYKKPASGRPSKKLEGDTSDSVGSLEGWEIAMREKLVNMKEMISFSKELLSWLEDMTTAGDLQEAFDVMGILETVLNSAYSTCDDFVRAAIVSGQS